MSRVEGSGDVARIILTLPGPEERSEILVGRGLRTRLAGLLAEHAPAHGYALIADETVAELHGRAVLEDLEGSGLEARLYTFPPGESSKTVATWGTILEALARDGHGRDACIVGLGGGVSCDLAGFVAASFLRGVPLVQIPTTLLAMVDAAIGGKTGVDLAAGKNLAGAFWQPRLVLVDPSLLDSLPEAELRGGLAEVVKHGAIADAAAFESLETRAEDVLGRDPETVARLVADSVRVKTSFVVGDAREAGPRAALNFGHTVAHAVESVSGYAIAHGPAVAMGMVVEARLGESLGVTESGTAERLGTLLSRLGLPREVPGELDPAAILEASRTDKKARAGRVRYTLLARIGTVARPPGGGWTHRASEEAVLAALEWGGRGSNDGTSDV